MESAENVKGVLVRRALVALLTPFVILLFVNGVGFAAKFLLLTAAFYFVMLGYFVSEITVKPPWYRHLPNARMLSLDGLPDYWLHVNDPKHNLNIEYEEVTFRSDSYTLSGWFVPAVRSTDSAKRRVGVVLVHGGGRDRRAWLRHLPFFHRAGYDCLLFDLREHGLSTGAARGLCFGIKERFDVIAAAQYVRSRGASRVAAVGTSVGASAVIMAAAISTSIDVVIAENPVLTAAHLQDQHIQNIMKPYVGGSRFGSVLFGAFRRCCSTWLNWKIGNKPSRHCQAMHVIHKIAPRPTLLMHGTYDTVVPPCHSERLFELAGEPKELWLCPKAHHCGLWNVEPALFEQHVLSFLDRHCPQQSPGHAT